ncbi:hypothetical protein NV379_20265 [Paenibacillus sp. N1-5-1-14]|uniref:hypothetical protein n=1 Tax=Paenibacillus radicibacter TaxID=2972488 RepID=UPI002159845B|nr:hypothetical protein [Paenibacillus radicibacter]MCR8644992.1 hypothetical protein [Paenibacillus radicibacter]
MAHRKLTPFEEAIRQALIDYHCDEAKAKRIIQTYLPVIRRLDDRHESARVLAQRYMQAADQGVRVEEWLHHIEATAAKYGGAAYTPAKPVKRATKARKVTRTTRVRNKAELSALASPTPALDAKSKRAMS